MEYNQLRGGQGLEGAVKGTLSVLLGRITLIVWW
jgi:hypothetical protein